MRNPVTLLAALLSFLTLLSGSFAQTPQQRREELLKVQELVNDPDPLMRLANFESIVRSNDALKIQTAIRIAMTSRDSSLRSLALQAYLAATRVISLELTIPPALLKQWQSVREDRARRDLFIRENRSASTFAEAEQYLAGRVQFLFLDAQVGAAKGQVAFTRDGARPHGRPVEYRVLGERLQFTDRVWFGGLGVDCLVELTGTRDLTLAGTLSCTHPRFGPVGLVAPMY